MASELLLSAEDILSICETDVRVDSDVLIPQILPRKLEKEDAEQMDQALDMMDAVSIAFLFVQKTENAHLICKILEGCKKNEIPHNGLGFPQGIVQLFWYSAQKNNSQYFEAKICECMYLTRNLRILNTLGLDQEVAKEKFQNSYLDPWAVRLYRTCMDMSERDRLALTQTLSLNPRYSMLELQLLEYLLVQQISMERFVSSHLPPQLANVINPNGFPVSAAKKRSTQPLHYPKGPGYVVIINQKIFKRDWSNPKSKLLLESRLGTDIDRDRLQITFTYLGAKTIRIFNDLNSSGVRAELDECASYLNNNHEKYEWLCVCILSHGSRTKCGRDEVYGCDGVPVDRREIVSKFADERSVPGFKGKPKIFIFQACRSSEHENAPDPQKSVADPQNSVADPQNSVADPQNSAADPQNSAAEPQNSATDPQNSAPDLQFSVRDGNDHKSASLGIRKDEIQDLEAGLEDLEVQTDSGYPAITDGDYFECSSTIPHFVTFRSTLYGSFYIRHFCEELLKEGHRDDIASIHTYVQNRMQSISSSYPSAPESISRLTKKFFFHRTKESLRKAAEMLVQDSYFRAAYQDLVKEMSQFPHNNLDVV